MRINKESFDIKQIFKILLVNIAIVYIIISLFIIIPPLYKYVENVLAAAVDYDERADIPSLRKYTWAQEYFREAKKTSTTYFDYVGWRYHEFKGKYIHIDMDGYRRHDLDNQLFQSDVWFFGGSTMWGVGTPDQYTIPAYFDEMTGMRSFNLATPGYTAHQGLNLLLKNYMLGGRPYRVFFYDGVNDVAQKCRKESDYYSSSRQNQIRTALGNSKNPLRQILTPSINIFAELFSEFNFIQRETTFYDCSTNRDKGRLVARALLYDWLDAKRIVEAHGGIFHAVLQPVSYIGNPNISYLNKVKNNHELRQQFEFVYGEIRKLAKEQKFEYIDFTDAFDGEAKLYYDFSHVNPEGNRIIAEKFGQIINNANEQIYR